MPKFLAESALKQLCWLRQNPFLRGREITLLCLLSDVFDRQRVGLRLKALMLQLDRCFWVVQTHRHIFDNLFLTAVNGRYFLQVCGLAFLSQSWLICCLIQLNRVLSGLFIALLASRPVHILICRRFELSILVNKLGLNFLVHMIKSLAWILPACVLLVFVFGQATLR